MQVGRRQVYNYTLAGDMISQRLKGRGGAQQALFYGHIGKTHQMDTDSTVDVYLHRHFDRLHTHTFGAYYPDKHFNCLF